jgi:hypothetical protein
MTSPTHLAHTSQVYSHQLRQVQRHNNNMEIEKVIAKFQCLSVKTFHSSQEIEFMAVTSESPENKTWSKWTPSGNLKMTITNDELFGHFKPAQNYLITVSKFTPQ